jgi:hypothetical protein
LPVAVPTRADEATESFDAEAAGAAVAEIGARTSALAARPDRIFIIPNISLQGAAEAAARSNARLPAKCQQNDDYQQALRSFPACCVPHASRAMHAPTALLLRAKNLVDP